MTTANTNTRASLLAGLRTGGVRPSTVDTPHPHTASPAGSFNLRRLSSNYPFLEEETQVTENFYKNISQDRDVPVVDGSINRFSQHQPIRGMNPNSVPFSPGFAPNMTPQAQIQMQMFQLEMMRIQVCCVILNIYYSHMFSSGSTSSATVSRDHGSGDASAAFTIPKS